MTLYTLLDDEKGNSYRVTEEHKPCYECGENTDRLYLSWGWVRCCSPRCFQDVTDNLLHQM